MYWVFFLNSAPYFIFSCHQFLNINHCGRNGFMRSSLLFMPRIWRDQVMKRRGENRFLLKNLRVRCGSQAQGVYLRVFLSAFFPFLFLLNPGKMFPLCFCMWPLISQSNGDNLFIRITYHHLEKMDIMYHIKYKQTLSGWGLHYQRLPVVISGPNLASFLAGGKGGG